MARNNKRFRLVYNALVDAYSKGESAQTMPTETVLADRMNVSRTVIRSALKAMQERGIIDWQGREKTIVRVPTEADKIPIPDYETSAQDLESRFLEWVLRFDVPAGTTLNIAMLSRHFSVSPHILQEFLASLRSFGLVERRPKGGWVLLGFTADFAIELSELRMILEADAVHKLIDRPVDDPIWERLETLRHDHIALGNDIEKRFHDFSRLDEKFHLAINSVVRNRFVEHFQKVIALIFHYHYMWDKREEKTRNAAAIDEHLAIIEALQLRDKKAALDTVQAHLQTSKTTLLSSLRSHHFS